MTTERATADELLARINSLGSEESRGVQTQRRQEILAELKELEYEAKDRERLAQRLSLIVLKNRVTDARMANLKGAAVSPSSLDERPALAALNATKRLQQSVQGRYDVSEEEKRLLSQAVDVLWAFSVDEGAATA